jgi:hypothetical protein
MTRPRVVPARGGGTTGDSVVAKIPAISLWPGEPEAPVAGALARYSLLLPAGLSPPRWGSLPRWASTPERSAVR